MTTYFSRDSEVCEIPLPPKPTHSRERSLTKPLSPRMLRHSIATPTEGSSPLRNSWPDSGMEEAPPLPPRSHSKYIQNAEVQICFIPKFYITVKLIFKKFNKTFITYKTYVFIT